MIVEDSVVIRSLLRRWFSGEPDISVVGACANGREAVERAPGLRPEVIVLDIEMPEMDGLTALPELVRLVPNAAVIMASTLTRRNAEISLKAMSMGAADYIAKPESAGMGQGADQFRAAIISKIRGIGSALRAKSAGVPKVARHAGAPAPAGRAASAVSVLRAPSQARVGVLGIGSSTGGPQAVLSFLQPLARALTVPVLITQHMPRSFTSIFADHLAKALGVPCKEGLNGEPLRPGRIYLAPGDHHMIAVPSAGGITIGINQDPPEHFCRPAVDPLFRSLAAAFGKGTLAVVLTGMGTDGRDGAQTIVNAGGTVFAQDETTSVVWGMPGAVAGAGLCSAIAPVPDLAARTGRMLKGERT